MSRRPTVWAGVSLQPDLSTGTCVGMDPDVFDTDLRASSSEREEAEAACGRCPVRAACHDWAERIGEVGMVWAGKARTAGRAVTDLALRASVRELDQLGWSTEKIVEELGAEPRKVAAIRNAVRRSG